jgi:molecular chaperone IbpA
LAPGRPVAAATADYDLVCTGEESWRLDIAAPGFTEADLEIETRATSLVVRGTPPARPGDEEVVHAGFVRTPFARRFALGEHVRVARGSLAEGVLSIDLFREVPDAMKPRNIEIGRVA